MATLSLPTSERLEALEDPGSRVRVPLHDALREPESDLALSGLNSIRAVADVAAHILAEVAADGARSRVARAGSAEELAALRDGVAADPDHADHRARGLSARTHK